MIRGTYSVCEHVCVPVYCIYMSMLLPNIVKLLSVKNQKGIQIIIWYVQ